mgnify:CR=1 FL=1
MVSTNFLTAKLYMTRKKTDLHVCVTSLDKDLVFSSYTYFICHQPF